jgi:protein ImuB
MASFRPNPQPTAQLSLNPARRYLALYLPRWATDCLKRADPALREQNRPLVLWEKQKGAMRIVALDIAASAEGLTIGQTVSDARGLVPHLDAREIDRFTLEQVFADFADWHSNASPLVAVLTHSSVYGDLCLDITGVSHLFSGEAAMLAMLTSRLDALGYATQGAIASTIGAAWALAHFAPGKVLAEGNEAKALAHLPVIALRLEQAQVDTLNTLGLKTIGQLHERNRKEMQARLGASFLLRLDQALGWVEEKLVPRLPVAELFAEHRFAEPIGLIDDVLMCAHDLAVQLSYSLAAKGLGGQAFHLFLYRVDHKVITLSVSAARATRDADHIGRLFSNRADRFGSEYDAGFGIDMIRLAVSSVSPLEDAQTASFDGEDSISNLVQLYDRMTSRLGLPSVVRVKPINTHAPELAMQLEPLIAPMPDDLDALLQIEAERPMRLLPEPEPIMVIAEVPDSPPASMVWRRITYRFVRASGPERLSAEWHRAGARLMLTKDTVAKARHPDNTEHYFEEGTISRDYYVAEDAIGRRFWLFRVGLIGVATQPRWYLHGFFT